MFLAFIILVSVTVTHGSPTVRNLFPRPNIYPGRVVGGRITDISEVPYQLQLEENGFQFCGASIISAQYALTAAHCTDGKSSYGLQVRSSSSYHAQGGSLTNVAAIYQHPGYSAQSTDCDVSILQLATPIPLDGNARPITLASTEPVPGQNAIVSGWGVQAEGTMYQPFQLQSVDIPINPREACTAAYQYMFTSNMLCAGGPGQDSCQGDSGGPLAVGGVQVGVVSWGYGCARPGYPGIYSNVAQLRGFIDMYTGFQAKWMALPIDEQNSTEIATDSPIVISDLL